MKLKYFLITYMRKKIYGVHLTENVLKFYKGKSHKIRYIKISLFFFNQNSLKQVKKWVSLLLTYHLPKYTKYVLFLKELTYCDSEFHIHILYMES